MPEKIAVIGFGSLNGVDQAGWMVIDLLAQKNIENLITFQSKSDGADWFSLANDARLIIFVDAIRTIKSNNTLHVLQNLSECKNIVSSSSHTISILESIELAQVLGYLKAPFLFIGIELSDVENMDELVSKTVDYIIEECAEHS